MPGPKDARPNSEESNDLVALLSKKVVGQPAAMKYIVPYVYMYQSGLSPEGRPAGVFLLLGPTGTGKTKTVEAIAEVLHGHHKKLLKIDCGEFQLEHEVAKLIGSPPGYLGHRETKPILSQEELKQVTSHQCDLALVLFDEVEKAAPAMTRLLLGILDKGTLRLGDNSTVDFENTLIFFTSNLGAKEMMKELNPEIGFRSANQRPTEEVSRKLESIALAAVRKRFSPEFINRIDAVVTYQPLDSQAISEILDQHVNELQQHVNTRLGARCFTLNLTNEARDFLLKEGISQEYGARELKRTVHRQLTQPLATMVAGGKIEPGAVVTVEVGAEGNLALKAGPGKVLSKLENPRVLIVDDNRDLVLFLETALKDSGWELLTASSAQQARRVFSEAAPNTVLMDYLLGDADGIELALEFQIRSPGTKIIIMTGGYISADEEGICEERGIPVLRKPFLATDLTNLIRSRMLRRSVGGRSRTTSE